MYKLNTYIGIKRQIDRASQTIRNHFAYMLCFIPLSCKLAISPINISYFNFIVQRKLKENIFSYSTIVFLFYYWVKIPDIAF